MIKLTTLNNKIYFHVIHINTTKNDNNVYDMYISFTQFYNLIVNESIAITIKKAIPQENDKNFKPRNEVVAKLYTKNKKTILKIGIGKNFKPIESIEDLESSWETEIENYNDIKNFVVQDFEKFELYEELRKQLKQKQVTSKNIKTLEDF